MKERVGYCRSAFGLVIVLLSGAGCGERSVTIDDGSSGGVSTEPGAGGSSGTSVCGAGGDPAIEAVGGNPQGQPPPICAPDECENPTPVLFGETPTGFERCSEATGAAWVHRPHVAVCPRLTPREGTLEPIFPPTDEPPPSGMVYDECTRDSDCTGPLEFCGPSLTELPGGCPGRHLVCRAGCEVDSDCDDGSICFCGDPLGVCIPANCTWDEDCLEGYHCSGTGHSYREFCEPPEPFAIFACTTPEDTCRGANCSRWEGLSPRSCGPDEDGHRRCF